MSRVVHRLRWRLAQAVAPTDIVAGPGHDGPALLVREPGDTALMWITPDQLRLRSSNRLSPVSFDEDGFAPRRRLGSFVGTFGADPVEMTVAGERCTCGDEHP